MSERRKAYQQSRGALLPIKKTVHSPSLERNYSMLGHSFSRFGVQSYLDYLIVTMDANLRASSEEPLYRFTLPHKPVQTQICEGTGECAEVGGSL